MEDAARRAVPAWFWLVAVLALVWEAIGCFAYLAQVGMITGKYAQGPAEQTAAWNAMPVWVWCAFAVAVWVGLSGALLLLARNRLARAAFFVSLLAAVIQFGGAYLIGDAAKLGSRVMPAIVIVLGAFLVWFSGMAARRGWLR